CRVHRQARGARSEGARSRELKRASTTAPDLPDGSCTRTPRGGTRVRRARWNARVCQRVPLGVEGEAPSKGESRQDPRAANFAPVSPDFRGLAAPLRPTPSVNTRG